MAAIEFLILDIYHISSTTLRHYSFHSIKACGHLLFLIIYKQHQMSDWCLCYASHMCTCECYLTASIILIKPNYNVVAIRGAVVIREI